MSVIFLSQIPAFVFTLEVITFYLKKMYIFFNFKIK